MSPEPNRLLIVDDDPELLRFLIDELSSAGHQCIGCDNGQDALLRWRQEQFDLVLLDWTLPDFSGVELCRRLRSSGNTTPVLMICLLYTSPSPRDLSTSRMPSSA